jgi:hypothetical protein
MRLNNILPNYETVMMHVQLLSSGRMTRASSYRYSSRSSAEVERFRSEPLPVDRVAQMQILKREEAAQPK